MIAVLLGTLATGLLLLGCTAVVLVAADLEHRSTRRDTVVAGVLLVAGLAVLALSTHLSRI